MIVNTVNFLNVSLVTFIDFTGITYYVPKTTGSIYDWRINGGLLVSGQGTSEIVVDWDGPGENSLFYF